MATARLSSTTGDGLSASRAPYSSAICAQSVVSASGAWICRAVIAACSWYSPGRRRRTARSSLARPSAIRPRSQSARSWSSSAT